MSCQVSECASNYRLDELFDERERQESSLLITLFKQVMHGSHWFDMISTHSWKKHEHGNKLNERERKKLVEEEERKKQKQMKRKGGAVSGSKRRWRDEDERDECPMFKDSFKKCIFKEMSWNKSREKENRNSHVFSLSLSLSLSLFPLKVSLSLLKERLTLQVSLRQDF